MQTYTVQEDKILTVLEKELRFSAYIITLRWDFQVSQEQMCPFSSRFIFFCNINTCRLCRFWNIWYIFCIFRLLIFRFSCLPKWLRKLKIFCGHTNTYALQVYAQTHHTHAPCIPEYLCIPCSPYRSMPCRCIPVHVHTLYCTAHLESRLEEQRVVSCRIDSV